METPSHKWRKAKSASHSLTSCANVVLKNPNCKLLFDKYKLVSQLAVDENTGLGVGSFGIIYEVFNTVDKRMRVIKAVNYVPDETENEINIMCMLSHSSIPNFIKYYDSFICEDTPEDWLTFAVERGFDKTIAYIEMEQASGSLYSLLYQQRAQVDVNDLKSIIFEIIYSIQNARDQLKEPPAQSNFGTLGARGCSLHSTGRAGCRLTSRHREVCIY